MPTFSSVQITQEVTVEADIDFEVFCGTCGTGLCFESSTRRSRQRGELQVEVNTCPDCLKEKDNEIENLKDENYNLQQQIDLLTDELNVLRSSL